MQEIAPFFEIAMIIFFGFSWPNNILTTLRNKSTKGKSLTFLILIATGYLCGIIGKTLGGNIVFYVLFFYILNFVMVSIDLFLYFYYKKKETRNLITEKQQSL